MKSIALSLLLIFTTFTVVLSTYYLWQEADFQVAMPIEEEEDHSHGNSIPFKAIFNSNHAPIQLLSDEESKNSNTLCVEKCYEDVYLNSPFSPPDVM